MTVADLHRWARPIVEDSLVASGLTGEPLSVAQAEQAVGFIETTYGKGWKGAGKDSNNWGADQSGKPPCNGGFLYTDTHPNADGSSTPYSICFRKYQAPVDGATGLARIMYLRRPTVLAAARSGDFYGVSAALHATRYYEGFGKTVAARIANHYKALSSAIRGQCAALGEPLPNLPPPPEPEPWQDEFLPDNPLILRGSFGPYVKIWQRILNDWLRTHSESNGIAVDGAFGPVTLVETKLWQAAHSVKVDGKVGTQTWTAAARVGEGER